jgi:hypothetical protein
MPEIIHLDQVEFRESMLRLRSRGGVSQRAFDEACRIIKCLEFDADVSNKITKWGESRIDHCIKYDLSNDHHRLVTVHSNKFIYLLFVGSHDDTEKWLNRNRGLTITCNPQTRKIVVTHVTKEERRETPNVNFATLTEANIPYFQRIGFDPAELVPQKFLIRALSKVDDNTSEEELEELVEDLSDTDSKIANLILDLIFEIRGGDLIAAKARLEQHRSEVIAVQEARELEEAAIRDIQNSENLLNLTGLTEEQLKELFSPDKFHKWMLFLHPEQKRIAEAVYEKPCVLTGVSGSGKTCVLVHRARHLAKKYPGERIGVLTLNRSLTRLIDNLIKQICNEEERVNIKVMAFYDYFETLVRHFGPKAELEQLKILATDHDEREEIVRTIDNVDPTKYAREFDPLSKEDLNDAWHLFCEQPYVRTLITYFNDHFKSHGHGADPIKYLREEFSLIRSALPTSDRHNGYMKLKRKGRAVPFPKNLRKRILDLLLLYEETILSGGLLDELSLTLTILPHLKEIKQLPDRMRFRSLLIDEFQDLSSRDLALLRLIPTQKNDGFFVTGDTVQRVMVKDLRLDSVGLGRGVATLESIKKNYRNSRQILETASHLANTYGEQARILGEDIDILDPELAVRETSYPVAEECLQGDEIASAWEYARKCMQEKATTAWSICIVTAAPEQYTPKDIAKSCPADFPVKIGQISGDYIENRDTLSVGNMSDVKGFEFSMVLIVGCGANLLPSKGSCQKESWREALRLYIAMTRARDEVRLFYSGKPSEFLLTMGDGLLWSELARSDRNSQAQS